MVVETQRKTQTLCMDWQSNPIADDGHCLFAAIAEQIDERDAAQIRFLEHWLQCTCKTTLTDV